MTASFAQRFAQENLFWQAPLPFDFLPAAFSGKISAAGAVGVIRIASHHTLEDVAQRTLAAAQKQMHYAFSHLLPASHQGSASEALPALEKHYQKKITPPKGDDFKVILQSCLPYAASIGFINGIPERDVIQEIKNQGVMVYAYCSNVLEALTAERYGMDFLVLQGLEAGGERVGFSNDLPEIRLPALSLLQQVRKVVSLPLVLWGDFSSSVDCVAALLCGAKGIMLDRPFLACREAQLTEAQRQRVIHAHEYDSKIDHFWMAKALRYVASAQDVLQVKASEGIWEALLSRNALPLPISLSPITDPVDFPSWFHALQSEMQTHLA